MKQSTSQRISESTLDWRDADSVALYEFPVTVITKKAPTVNHRKRLAGAEFEEQLAELCREQLTKKINDTHIGCRIVLVVTKRNFDLDNAVKSIWDSLKSIAFDDDKQFDYLEIVRVKADSVEDEAIVVEILLLTEKRVPWL